MIHSRRTLLKSLCLLIAMACLPLWAAAQDSARVEVILVEASNKGDGIDSSLKQYSSTLQRLFRFQSYRQAARKSVRLKVPGSGSTALPGGQALALKADKGNAGSLMADLQWTRGSKRLLHTRIQLRRGQPAVLGGPRTREGTTQLLILVLR